MAVKKKTKQEQAAIRKATLEKKAAAKRKKAHEDVMKSVDQLEEEDEETINEEGSDANLSNTDDGKSDEESTKTSENEATKRKSFASATITPSSSAKKQKKIQLLTTPRHSLLKEVVMGGEEEDIDDIDSNSNGAEGMEQKTDDLRATLIDREERLQRAERQVRTISKTRLADTFFEGQVRSWTKETLWKMCKFITDEQTMRQVMKKASKHFKVPAEEQEDWMATYSHVVRDGLNQKRNACSQDLRKTIKSKCHVLHSCC
jgi:hypothetical protein